MRIGICGICSGCHATISDYLASKTETPGDGRGRSRRSKVCVRACVRVCVFVCVCVCVYVYVYVYVYVDVYVCVFKFELGRWEEPRLPLLRNLVQNRTSHIEWRNIKHRGSWMFR